MMELLIRFGLYALIVFGVAALTSFYALFNRDESLYLVAVLCGSGGLTSFLSTEVFGPISRQRRAVSRRLARVFLVFFVLIILWFVVVGLGLVF